MVIAVLFLLGAACGVLWGICFALKLLCKFLWVFIDAIWGDSEGCKPC